MMASVRKYFRKRVVTVIVASVLAFCVISLGITKVIYDAIFLREDGSVPPAPAALEELVSGRESWRYDCQEHHLTGHLYRPQAGYDTLVVLVPGFHAGADSYLWQIQALNQRGWPVFAFDPTGSGASDGESSVGFSQIIPDLQATINHIEKNNRFGYNEIVLLGHSRGGYGACCVLEGGADVSAVISVSGVNSAMEGVVGMASQYIGALAWGNYGFLWLYQSILFDPQTVSLRADQVLARQQVDALIIHGAQDTQVPPDRFSIASHRQELSSRQVEVVLWQETDSAGHTDLLYDPDGTANEELMECIHSFLLERTN